jgi:hypothetical protein
LVDIYTKFIHETSHDIQVILNRCYYHRCVSILVGFVDVSAELTDQASQTFQLAVPRCHVQWRGSIQLGCVDICTEFVHQASQNVHIIHKGCPVQGCGAICICSVDASMKVYNKAPQDIKATHESSIAQGLRSHHPNALAPPSSKLCQIPCPARLHDICIRDRRRYTGTSGRHADFALLLAHLSDLRKLKSRSLRRSERTWWRAKQFGLVWQENYGTKQRRRAEIEQGEPTVERRSRNLTEQTKRVGVEKEQGGPIHKGAKEKAIN